MAKRNTYGYRAELERRKAQRRIEWHERILSRENLPSRMREKHTSEIRKLKAAQEATRVRTKEGKPIPNRNDPKKMDANLKKLESINRRSTMYSKSNERATRLTTIEMNKASVGDESSQFTKQQIQVFYRATQPAWDRSGVSIEDRNQIIMEYYGRSNLAKFILEVTKANEIAIKANEISPDTELTEEQRERYENEPDVNEKPDYHYANILDRIMEQMRGYIFEPERY